MASLRTVSQLHLRLAASHLGQPARRRGREGEFPSLRWIVTHMIEENTLTTGTPTSSANLWTARPGEQAASSPATAEATHDQPAAANPGGQSL